MGDRRRAYRVVVGNLKERGQLENLGVNGSMILIDCKRWMRAWTGLIWLRIGTGGGQSLMR
jgi:hypothetical protein